ncbi:hypothetical protein EZS27_027902 [termite gut metagenome]|uniref:Uncharacterized protein n=1 Tax=termite gut metagenome TaxID=433724 RepID=A0A5J4QKY2_9ZZZZ
MSKFYLDRNADWQCVEFLARKNQFGYDQPLIRYSDDGRTGDHVKQFIDIAQKYYDAGDNKTAGVYLRSAFEFMLKRYCYKKLRVRFTIDSSEQKTGDFWSAINDFKAEEDACIAGTTKKVNAN